MKQEIALQRIESFANRFGEAHLHLACHAALPLALTPDLLYRLWTNFPYDINGKLLNIPWIAVADLLLSSLCNEVGYELYEMETTIRANLLNKLIVDPRFGTKRLKAMCEFLLHYIAKELHSDDPDIRGVAQAQQWVALAYTQPDSAARELARAFTTVSAKNRVEYIRLAAITEILAERLKEHKQLLIYANGMANFARGNLQKATDILAKILDEKRSLQIAGVSLPIPEELFPKAKANYFEFESVTLDIKGKVKERFKGKAQYFTEDLGNGVVLEMVAIPGGKFLMGSLPSEENSYDDERPQHPVNVPPFYMGKYPITQAQWQAIMGNNPSHFGKELKAEERGRLPVEMISWQDAVEFCRKLSAKTGREYRLPSESEWEYACRAGTTTPFAFGETITPEFVNYNREKTTPVGSLGVANRFGLYDMHGNVWEWCKDTWHDSYNGAPDDGSAWVSGSDNERHVLRGGSWYDDADLCRAASRGNLVNSWYDSPALGFRVVVGARTLK